MNDDDYLIYVLTVYSKDRPDFIRLGQWAFNTLAETHPEIAEKIRGDELLDPFYKDENLKHLLTFLIS